MGKAAFLTAATGLTRHVRAEEMACRVCPQRPVAHTELRLCQRHLSRWQHHEKTNGEAADLAAWLGEQLPLPGYGSCRVAVCTNLADSPLGLCPWHGSRYHRDNRPGRARLPSSWWHRYEQFGRPVPIDYADEAAFRRWCATTPAPWWPGQINLRGLRPLVRAEIKWGLFIHTQRARPTRWDLGWIRSLVATCRDHDVETLIGFPLGAGGSAYFTGAIVKEILHELRLVYFTPAETKDAGFIETDHFGVRFDQRASHVDLTGIPQRWLRDLVWDYLAALLQSPRCPRSGGVFDGIRRAAIELGAFLEIDAPGGGHDPTVLDGEHMRRFVADQRRRERDGLPSLAIKQPGGKASIVTTVTRSIVFNALHKMLRDAMDTGAADRIGLAREFIVAVPTAGATTGRTPRRPFPDEVARALADEDNLAPARRRSTIRRTAACATSGRPPSSPAGASAKCCRVRWDCLGRYGGLPMFWHDQTKVGNYDAAIRIPERLHDVIAERQRKTLERFIAAARPPAQPTPNAQGWRCSRPPTATPTAAVALTYQWFHSRFTRWIDRTRPRPLRAASGPPHPGHQPAARRGQPHPHPPLPRPGQRPDGRTLCAPVEFGPGGRAAAGLGRRTRHRQPRRTSHR